MRTTISLDDDLFRMLKARAAQRGTTLSAEIEEALRADAALRARPDAKPFVLSTTESKVLPGVDVNSNAALMEMLDAAEGRTLR